MALTATQAFKAGFLARCAAEGMTLAETRTAVKTAVAKTAVLGTVVGQGLDLGKSLAGLTLGWALPLGLVAPPIAGGLAAGTHP